MSALSRSLSLLMKSQASLTRLQSQLRELADAVAPVVDALRQYGAPLNRVARRLRAAAAKRRQRDLARLEYLTLRDLAGALYAPEPTPPPPPIEAPALTLHALIFSRVLFATAPPALPFRQGRDVATH